MVNITHTFIIHSVQQDYFTKIGLKINTYYTSHYFCYSTVIITDDLRLLVNFYDMKPEAFLSSLSLKY
jgi:hypothetical protein